MKIYVLFLGQQLSHTDINTFMLLLGYRLQESALAHKSCAVGWTAVLLDEIGLLGPVGPHNLCLTQYKRPHRDLQVTIRQEQVDIRAGESRRECTKKTLTGLTAAEPNIDGALVPAGKS